MNPGNIMYASIYTNKLYLSNGNYKSIKQFDKVMLGMAKGLYKLGDYKNTRGPRPEPA